MYYLLGEEFDRDPFLLFRLRGLGREELLQRLSRAAPTPVPPDSAAKRGKGHEAADATEGEPSPLPSEPLSADSSIFWSGGLLAEDVFGVVQPPPVSGAWLRRLGGLPFWRGETPLPDALEPIYQAASAHGLQAFLGERPDEVDPEEIVRRPRVGHRGVSTAKIKG